MSDENKKNDFDEKKTVGSKYDGTPYEDDIKNYAPFLKVLTDGLMPIEGAKKITKAVDEAFPKIFDEVSWKLRDFEIDMATASAASLSNFVMFLSEMQSFSWNTLLSEHFRNGSTGVNSFVRFYDEIIEYAKENRFAAIRASYNLALTCETPDPRIVKDCEKWLKVLDDESLDKTYESSVNGETGVDKRLRATAAGAMLDFIAKWRLREHFTEWVREGRPDKSRGSEKGGKGDDLSK